MIKITKINLGSVEANTNGKLAKYRAEKINRRIEELEKELKNKKGIVTTASPYAGKFCIENLGIYCIPGKGSIPIFANLMVYKDGFVTVELNYHKECSFSFIEK